MPNCSTYLMQCCYNFVLNCLGREEEAVGLCCMRDVWTRAADRLFYVCARADGLPPEGRCNYFVWADSREPRAECGAVAKRPRK